MGYFTSTTCSRCCCLSLLCDELHALGQSQSSNLFMLQAVTVCSGSESIMILQDTWGVYVETHLVKGAGIVPSQADKDGVAVLGLDQLCDLVPCSTQLCNICGCLHSMDLQQTNHCCLSCSDLDHDWEGGFNPSRYEWLWLRHWALAGSRLKQKP